MKRILVTTLLLSCMTLVGCNPVTMKITASDDLSNINVEVDGFSLENITMQEDGSVNVSFDNPGTATQTGNATVSTQDVIMQNASMQTPVVLGSTTQNSASNNQSNDVTGQNTTTQSTPASNDTAQTPELNTTVQNNVTNTETTDNTANNAATTQVQTKDSYGVFKDLVKNHLTAYDNIHSIELNPEAVDFSFVSGVNNDWTRVDKAIVVKHSAGKVFLVLGYDAMSADYVVEVYEVSGDVPTYCSTATNVRVISYDPNEKTFGTEVTVNVLGTYWVGMVHELKDNGEFAVKGNIYTMDTSYNVERHTLTVTKELPVWMEGGNTTLQPGTKIIIDGASTWNEMFFKVAETGEGGYITYEFDAEGRVTINGVSEAEYFEVLPYTG
ncbi:MAG: hypothetical protein J6A80_05895 [Lachnospiraceae bacterium]|nr:hypothetical protein [Lachnospiraceae bacterium]